MQFFLFLDREISVYGDPKVDTVPKNKLRDNVITE